MPPRTEQANICSELLRYHCSNGASSPESSGNEANPTGI